MRKPLSQTRTRQCLPLMGVFYASVSPLRVGGKVLRIHSLSGRYNLPGLYMLRIFDSQLSSQLCRHCRGIGRIATLAIVPCGCSNTAEGSTIHRCSNCAGAGTIEIEVRGCLPDRVGDRDRRRREPHARRFARPAGHFELSKIGTADTSSRPLKSIRRDHDRHVRHRLIR